jgi:nucleoside 2-deoxyribosyltransferase
MRRVYLAGPIEYAEDGGADWRREATEITYDPEQGFDLLLIDPTHYDGTAQGLTPEEIVTRDRYLLRHSDGLIFDARSTTPGWGTAMEALDAWQHGIPTVAWGAPEKRSAFLQYHVTKFVPTVREALEYLDALLLRGR